MALFTSFDKSDLSYNRLDIRISAVADNYFDAWLGAVLRNNLLFATEQIIIREENVSLYKYMNKFSLEKDHNLYNQLHNGFPLPYYLFIHYPLSFSSEKLFIRRNEIISFSLILIGPVCRYFRYFTEALRYMCRRGFGIGMGKFELLDVYEVPAKGDKRIIAVSNENLTDELIYPVNISDFIEEPNQKKGSVINIVFESPVNLIKLKNKEEKIPGFQEKSNAFPSFYQLVRTAAHRFMKLNILYSYRDTFKYIVNIDERIDEYINDAAKLTLRSAEIKYMSLKSTKKEGTGSRIPLRGYVGNLSFTGKYEKYLPMLLFMQDLGVGHELTYGLGKYKMMLRRSSAYSLTAQHPGIRN